MSRLVAEYQRLINDELPQRFTTPVRFNHCFARIVLDWLFQDCWYHHLTANGPAYRQLSEAQLMAAIERMKAWLQNPLLLTIDNNASLQYRHRRRQSKKLPL